MQFCGGKYCMSFIVIDGLDGCGKSTQFEALREHFGEENTVFISFPDYERESSAPVRMYLGGEISSDPDDINAYAASSFYAVDRYISYRQVWEKELAAGKNIIASRYVSSNAIHQMSKLPESEREDFLDWLEDYEYRRLGLPVPDRVIFLDMPPETAQELLSARYGGDDSRRDIHEKKTDYLCRCRKSALFAAELRGWDIVKCADEKGSPLPPRTITEELLRLIGETDENA